MRAVVLVLLASVLFGTTGTAQALGASGVDVVSLGAARIVVGGVALALVAGLVARRRAADTFRDVGSGRSRALGSRRSRILAVVVGALGVVAYQPAFFLGTERNGVAVGAVVALGSAPLLTGALGWALGRRFPGARWAFATTVAVIGLAVLGGGGGVPDQAASIDPLGLAGSLGAGAAYGVYTLASKSLLDQGWSAPVTMGAVFGAAAVVGLVILVSTDTGWLMTTPGLATAIWLGLVTVTVAYLLFASGLVLLAAPTVATLTLAEPLTATLLGALVLGEQLTGSSWLGLAAIGVGIAVLVIRPRSTATRQAPS